MTARIREQIERVPDLKTKCTLTISTSPIELSLEKPGEAVEQTGEQTAEQQVETMANRVTQMILAGVDRRHSHAARAASKFN